MADETSDTTTDAEEIDDLIEEANNLIGIEGLWSGRILYTGVTLGLFELLDDDPMSAHELADELDLDAENTYRLLRALAHYDVLEEDENQCSYENPAAETSHVFDNKSSDEPSLSMSNNETTGQHPKTANEESGRRGKRVAGL